MYLTIIAVIIGILRVIGFKSEAYQAIAHILIGWLIATSLSGKTRFTIYKIWPNGNYYITLNFILLVLLTILEVVCAIYLPKN
jgi:hypothetical protein